MEQQQIELLRIGKMICFFGYQIPLWTCFVYQQNLLQIQFFAITETNVVSPAVYLLYELLHPVTTLVVSVLMIALARYAVQKSLRVIMYGIEVLFYKV